MMCCFFHMLILGIRGDLILTLGEKLKELREDLDLFQKDVATELNISSNTLSNYERDERDPDFVTLVNLANIYHVNVDYLLGNTEIKTSWKDYTGEVKLQDRTIYAGKIIELLNAMDIERRTAIILLMETHDQK